MGYWQIKYGGVTKDAAAWGVAGIKRTRESARTDTVTFSLPGWDFTTTPPFAYEQQVTIYANGVQWFVGWVSKLPRKGNAAREQQDYEISGPWWWLERTPFQQMWITNAASGGSVAQVTTAQSSVILGQALNGLKLSSGQVILEAMLYAQYAFQGQPYPTTTLSAIPSGAPPSFWPSSVPTTDLINLPSPPDPANGTLPFQIGVVSPSIATVFSEVRDKKCADIIRLAMRYTPDAVAWTDHTTSPPTINIDRRGNLDGKAIAVLGGNVVGEFDPEPRYDLVPAAVLVKYQTTQTTNGSELSFLIVDQYPTGVADNNPRNIIFTLDLVGSSTTTQTAKVETTPRPVSAADSDAMSWFFTKEPWLKAQKPTLGGAGGAGSGSALYDTDNMSCVALTTAIDPNDPLNTNNPNGVTLPACTQLVNELKSAFPGWLQEAYELDMAEVVITPWIAYSGSDALTKTLFWYDPTNPTVPKTDGSGYLPPRTYNVKVTNADTESYTRLTSYQGGEPVPVGVAEYMYNALATLHWSGSIKFIEQECSDILPIGCIFNTSDGDAAWAAMNALVLRVVEDIDTGTTTVTFGPPLMLGFQDLIEIIRANEGVRPSMQLSQRTDGQTASGAQVTETKHAGGTSVSSAPGAAAGASAPTLPFSVSSRVNPSTGSKEIKVLLNSTLFTDPSQGNNIVITGLDTWIGVSGTGVVYLKCSVTSSGGTPSAITGPTIATCGPGGDYNTSGLAWNSGSFVENDSASPPNQTYARVWIASYDATGAGAPVITQRLTSHLYVKNCQFAYLPALFPFPLT